MEMSVQKLKDIITSVKFITSPTHINLHLSEPVDDHIQNYTENTEIILDNLSDTKKDKSKENQQLLNKIQKAKKPLFIVGSGEYSTEEIELILSTNIPTMLDVTTGHKTTLLPSENLVPSFDHPEVRTYFNENPPDLVVKFGQYVITKHLSKLKVSKEGLIFEEDY